MDDDYEYLKMKHDDEQQFIEEFKEYLETCDLFKEQYYTIKHGILYIGIVWSLTDPARYMHAESVVESMVGTAMVMDKRLKNLPRRQVKNITHVFLYDTHHEDFTDFDSFNEFDFFIYNILYPERTAPLFEKDEEPESSK